MADIGLLFMRSFVELLVALVVAVTVPMFTCEAVFRLDIRSGQAVCGHNTLIQIAVIFLIGLTVVIARFLVRRDRHPSDRHR